MAGSHPELVPDWFRDRIYHAANGTTDLRHRLAGNISDESKWPRKCFGNAAADALRKAQQLVPVGANQCSSLRRQARHLIHGALKVTGDDITQIGYKITKPLVGVIGPGEQAR